MLKKVSTLCLVMALMSETVAATEFETTNSCSSWVLNSVHATAFDTDQSKAKYAEMKERGQAHLSHVALPGELVSKKFEGADMVVVPGQIVEWCFARLPNISPAAMELKIKELVPTADMVTVTSQFQLDDNGHATPVLAVSYRVTAE